MDEADVQMKARRFMAGLDLSDIHNDLKVYLKAVKGKVVLEEMDEGQSGSTITAPSGKHVMTINSLELKARQRFTICHEIAHVVLDLPSSHEVVPPWSYAKRDVNEVYCDIFAAELLMPVALWQKRLPAEEPSIEVIEYMASEFQVSFPAAASRYASLSDHPCAYVTMERGTVRYAARSAYLRRARAWIQPKTPIPAGSVAHGLRASGASGKDSAVVDQDIWFENWEKGLDMKEVARHFHRTDTTGSLLWFDEEDLPEKPAGFSEIRARDADDGGLAELTGELVWRGRSRHR